MSRKNRGHAGPNFQGPAIDAGQAPLESGAGNMSAADLAALGGRGFSLEHGQPLAALDDIDVAESELSQDIEPRRFQDSEVFAHLVQRLVTLEGRVSTFESALEAWAKAARAPAKAVTVFAEQGRAIEPASQEEQAACSAANFELFRAGKPQFNGIQEWRDAGRPGATV
jgi:hypothetical protein